MPVAPMTPKSKGEYRQMGPLLYYIFYSKEGQLKYHADFSLRVYKFSVPSIKLEKFQTFR